MLKISNRPLINAIKWALLPGLGWSACTAAAEPATGQLEEIIVTAELRSENLQTTPISVSAFTADDLVNRGIVELSGIAVRTPGFVFDALDQSEPNVFIRGIGNQNADTAANESPVAIYLDDVYIGRSGASVFDLFDIERVEVLRGPQGTLYGRNASGGVVHIVTKKPEDVFGGTIRAEIGDYNMRNIAAAVTGPVTDNLSFRIAGSSRDRDGYIFNKATGNDVGGEDSTYLKAALRFEPTENLEINLSADNVRERGTTAAHDTVYTTPAALAVAQSDPRPRIVNADTDPIRERDISGILLRVGYDWSWATLTSITAYRELESEYDFYFAGNPKTDDTIESFNINLEDSDQFSQEFRLGGSTDRLDWILGLYYFESDVDHTETFVQHFNGLYKAQGLPPSRWAQGNGKHERTANATLESKAVFGQATYRITDTLAATFGIRYTTDERSMAGGTQILEGTNPVASGGKSFYSTVEDDWDATTPRFGLEYHHSDSLFLYGTYTRGFKSGVFNAVAPTQREFEAPLKPEWVDNYEVGAKTEWLDNRLRFNVAVFYMEFQDLQISTLIPAVQIVFDNADAEIKGYELEFVAMPVEGLKIEANYSYLDTEITKGKNKGKVLPRAPEDKINASVAYTMQFGGWDITPRLDWSYQSMFYHEPDNRVSEIQRSYQMLDASVDFAPADKDWRITLWGKNLDDELVARSMVSVPAAGQNFVSYADPRTYGLTFTVNY